MFDKSDRYYKVLYTDILLIWVLSLSIEKTEITKFLFQTQFWIKALHISTKSFYITSLSIHTIN